MREQNQQLMKELSQANQQVAHLEKSLASQEQESASDSAVELRSPLPLDRSEVTVTVLQQRIQYLEEREQELNWQLVRANEQVRQYTHRKESMTIPPTITATTAANTQQSLQQQPQQPQYNELEWMESELERWRSKCAELSGQLERSRKPSSGSSAANIEAERSRWRRWEVTVQEQTADLDRLRTEMADQERAHLTSEQELQKAVDKAFAVEAELQKTIADLESQLAKMSDYASIKSEWSVLKVCAE